MDTLMRIVMILKQDMEDEEDVRERGEEGEMGENSDACYVPPHTRNRDGSSQRTAAIDQIQRTIQGLVNRYILKYMTGIILYCRYIIEKVSFLFL